MSDTLEARAVADEWALEVERLAEHHRRTFRERWPALIKWRERVISTRHRRDRRPPSEIAAALECLALECALAGEFDLADRAQREAIAAVQSATTPQTNSA